ncbi:MAG: hypothetical protein LBJ38_02070 [Oscillospiraceae bacterium]|nr:hypothetical protein [Oscillospiraceae bacterium]
MFLKSRRDGGNERKTNFKFIYEFCDGNHFLLHEGVSLVWHVCGGGGSCALNSAVGFFGALAASVCAVLWSKHRQEDVQKSGGDGPSGCSLPALERLFRGDLDIPASEEALQQARAAYIELLQLGDDLANNYDAIQQIAGDNPDYHCSDFRWAQGGGDPYVRYLTDLWDLWDGFLYQFQQRAGGPAEERADRGLAMQFIWLLLLYLHYYGIQQSPANQRLYDVFPELRPSESVVSAT